MVNLDGVMTADGLDNALVGVGRRCGQPTLAVYSVNKVLEILMKRDGMTDEEAVEYFEYNIEGSWMGENTPIWLYDDLES
jgi:hypothetical protein